MQLFQHTHSVLRDAVTTASFDIQNSDPDDIIAAESSLEIRDAGDAEEQAGEVRLKVRARRNGKSPKWEKISAAVEEFCGAVLSFAFNPLVSGEPRYEEGQEPVTVEQGTSANSISIVGAARDLSGRSLTDAEAQINHIEQLMFAHWQETADKRVVEKTFASEEEQSRVLHLLITMANAYGIDDKTAERHFHPTDNECSIRVDKTFLQKLIRREQTLEASIETERM